MRRFLLNSIVIWFVLCMFTAHAATYYWVGANGDDVEAAANDWHTVAGDVGAQCGAGTGNGAVPGAADDVIFHEDCDNNAVIGNTWNVESLTINSGYTGTITQSSPLTVDTNFTQNDGNFAGGSDTITIDDSLIISGGSFVSTSGRLNIYDDFLQSGSGGFGHNNGRVDFSDSGGFSTYTIQATDHFYDIEFSNSATGYVGIVGSIYADNDVYLTSFQRWVDGALYTEGDVITQDVAIDAFVSADGEGIVMIGSTAATVSTGGLGSTAEMPNFEMRKDPGGTVTLGDGDVHFIRDFLLTSGTFNSNGYELTLEAVDNSSFRVGGADYTIDDLRFFATQTFDYTLHGETIVVDGTLYLSDGDNIANGTIQISGNMYATNADIDGTATIEMLGSTNSYIYGDGGLGGLPGLDINKTGGAGVTMLTDIQFESGFILNSGWFNVNGYDVTIVGSATTTITSNGTTWNNVTLDKLDSIRDIAPQDDMFIYGDLTITQVDDIQTGDVYLLGDFIVTDGNFDVVSGASITMYGGNNQTITFSSSGAMDDGPLLIDKTAGQVNLASNLTLDTGAGNDLTIVEGTFDLNGNTLSVSSDLIVQDGGYFRWQGDETTTTPTLNSGSTVTYDATSGTRNIQVWTYDSVQFDGNGGTFTLSGAETIPGNLTVSAGTFDLSDQTLAINRNMYIEGGELWTGTNSFTIGDGASDGVTISGGTLIIESDTPDSDITINAGAWTNSGGVIEYRGGASTTLIDNATVLPYYDLKINSNGTTYTVSTAFDVDNDFDIADGEFDLNGQAMTVGGNWTLSAAGTFTPGTGSVDFDDDSKNNTITGNTTFYDLVISTATAKTVTFASGDQQAIAAGGSITMTGASGQELTLQPSVAATDWYLADGSGTQSVSYVLPTYSDASGGNTIVATNSNDGTPNGTNTNWSGLTILLITISGIIYESDGTTPETDAAKTVNIKVAGADACSGLCTDESSAVDGSWSIGSIAAGAGSTVAIYLDGETENANTLTISAGTNMGSVNLIQDHVIIRNDDPSTSTVGITDLDDYDNDQESDDLLFDADAGTPNLLTIEDGMTLLIDSSVVFVPAGTVTVGGGLDINGTWTAATDEHLYVDGSLDMTSGTFNESTGKVLLTSTSDSSTITSDGEGFYDLVMADGMIGWWQLDETGAASCAGGGDACDSSGYGREGTWGGNAQHDADDIYDRAPIPLNNNSVFDGSTLFDGVSDYIDFGDIAKVSHLTASVWAKWDSTAADANGAMIAKTSASTQMFELMIRTSDGVFWWATTGDWAVNTTSFTATTGEWAHYVLTFDTSNGTRVYANGVQVATDATTTALNTAGNLYVGGRVDATTVDFKGNLADVRVYDRALSADEVESLYLGGGNVGIGQYQLSDALTVSNDLYISSGTLDLNSQTTSVTGDIFHTSILERGGGETITGTYNWQGGAITYSGATSTISSDYLRVGDLSIDNASATYSIPADMIIYGDVHLLNGTLDATASDYDLTIYGDWNNTGGTFTERSGKVTFRGEEDRRTITSGGDGFNDVYLNNDLIGYWKLDETGVNQCTGGSNDTCDSSGNGHDGTWNGTTAASTDVPPTQFYNPRSLVFDGNSDYVKVPYRPDLYAENITIAFWVNSDTTNYASNAHVVNMYDLSSNNRVWSIAVLASSDNWLIYTSSDGTSGTLGSGETSQGVETGWHHIAATTADGGDTWTFYYDGGDIGDETGPNAYTDQGSFMTFGALDAAGYFDGKLDDIRYYKTALDAEAIGALASGVHPAYSAGNQYTLQDALDVNGDLFLLSGTLDVNSSSNYGITVGGDWNNYGGVFEPQAGVVIMDTSASSTIEMVGATFYTLRVNASGGTVSLTNDIRLSGDLDSDVGTLDTAGYHIISTGDWDIDATLDLGIGTHTVGGSINFTNGTITEDTSTLVLAPETASEQMTSDAEALNDVMVASADGLIRWWRMDETGPNTCSGGEDTCDSSGNGDHGTWASGPTPTLLRPPLNFTNERALDFDGANDTIQMSDINAIEETQVSYSFWARTEVRTQDHDFLVKGGHSSTAPLLVWLDDTVGGGAQSGNTDTLSVIVHDGSNQDWFSGPDNALEDEDWHHIVVTVNPTDSEMRLYIDGVLVTLGVMSGAGTNVSADVFYIGGPGGGTAAQDLEGQMDDVRIYNRILHPIEVYALYSGHPLSNLNGTITLQDALDIDGDMILADGTLAAGSNTITVGVDWSIYEAAFTAGTGLVNFDDDTQNNQIWGNTSFYGLEISTATAKTATFESGATQTINAGGSLTLTGADGQLLTLAPSDASTDWILTDNGSSQNVNYVSVSRSNAGGGNEIQANNSTDGGNNTNWAFLTAMIYTWLGATDTTWEDQTNWDSGDGSAGNDGYPDGSNDAVIVDDNISNIILSTAQTIDWLDMRSGIGLNTLDLNGNDLIVSTVMTISDGTFEIDSGASLSLASGTLTLSGGTLLLSGSGFFDLGEELNLTSGRLEFSSSTGYSTIAGDLTIGDVDSFATVGVGSFILDGGAASQTLTTAGATIGGLQIGSSSAGAVVTVTDYLYLDGDLTFGNVGATSLDISADYVRVGGNLDFTNGDTLTLSTGTIVMTSTDDATLTSSSNALNDLFINDGLVGYWKLDSTASSGVLDHSGYGNHGTVQGNPTNASSTASTYFINAGAIDFDGTGDYIETGDINALDNTTQFSITAWVKVDTASDWLHIFSKGVDVTNRINMGLSGAASGDNNDIRVGVYNGLSNSNGYTTGDIIDTSWHQWSMVYDGSQGSDATRLKFFFDGIQQSLTFTNTIPSSTNSNSATALIGRDYSAIYPWNGFIDDFRIYNRALSDAEVLRLAQGLAPATSQGGNITLGDALNVNGDLVIAAGTLDTDSANDYNINVAGSWYNYGGIFTTDGGNVIFDGTSGTHDIQSGQQDFYLMQVNGSGGTWNLAQNVQISDDLVIDAGTLDTNTYDLAITDALDLNAGVLDLSTGTHSVSGNVDFTNGTITEDTSTLVFNPNGSKTFDSDGEAVNDVVLTTTEGLVGWWRFDETAFNTCSGGEDACDSSGYGNHATETSTPTITQVTAPLNFSNVRAMEFDGSGDSFTTAYDASHEISVTATGITLSAWIYMHDVSGGAAFSTTNPRYIVMQDDDGNVGDITYGLRVLGQNLNFFYRNSGNTAFVDERGTGDAISSNQWHHVAAVHNTTAITLYIDGQAISSTTTNDSTDGNILNNEGLSFGRQATIGDTRYFDGVMDDVRIYSRPLSSSEIMVLYQGHELAYNGNVTLSADLDINNDLTIGSGTLDVSGSNYSITIGGDWDNDGTFISQTGTVTFDGTASRTIAPGDDLSTGTDFNDLVVSSSVSVLTVSGGTLEVDDQLTITASSLDLNGQDLTVGILSNTGTITLEGGETLSITTPDTDSGLFYFDGGSTYTVSTAPTFYDVMFNNAAATWTMGANVDAENDFTLVDGEFDDSGYRVEVAGNMDISSGTYTTTGTILMDSSDDATFTPPSTALNDLMFSDSLVGYWKLDSTASSGVLDHSSYGYHGTVAGNPTTATSDKAPLHYANAGAIDFDGTGDYVDMGDVTNFDYTDPFSVCAWAKGQAGVDAGKASIVTKMLSSGTYRGWFLWRDHTNDVVEVYIRNDQTGLEYIAVGGSTTFQLDEWVHACFTYDGSVAASGVELYYNGNDESESVIGDALAGTIQTTASLNIGARNGDSGFWTGLIDDVRIYDRVLSATEVAALAAGNTPNSGVANFTLAAAMDVDGNLTLASGTVLLGSYTHTLTGDWLNYGSKVTSQTSQVTLDGTSDGVIETGLEAFNDLVLNRNGYTLTVNDGISVDSTFTFTAGTITPSTDVDAVGLLTDLTMSNANVTFTGNATPVFMDGELTISNGQFTAPTTDLYVHNINQTGGTITSTTGTITFRSSADETLTVTNALNDLNVNEGLVGYWKFDESGSSTDYSGNGNTGTWTTAPDASTVTAPAINFTNNGSVEFVSGNSEYITVSDSDTLSFGDSTEDKPFSFAVWAFMDDATNFRIFSKNNLVSRAEWRAMTVGSDVFVFSLYDSDASNYIGQASDTALTNYESRWIHLAGTYTGSGNASGVTLYVNGAVFDSSDTTGGTYVAMENTTAPLHIGALVYASAYADGKMDDLRLYNRVLSPDEVKMLAHGFGPGASGYDIDYTLGGDLNLDNNLTVGAGTLDLSGSNYTITVGNDWTIESATILGQSGTFQVAGDIYTDVYATMTTSSSTLTLNGTESQWLELNGSSWGVIMADNTASDGGLDTDGITFADAWTTYDFTSQESDSYLYFQNGTTYTVNGTLTLSGNTVGNEITLDTITGAASAFIFSIGGTTDVAFVDVANAEADGQDINASFSIDGGGTDSGGTSPKWVFSLTALLNYFWVGDTSTDWSVAANWSATSGGGDASQVPGATDKAVFDSGSQDNAILSSPTTIGDIDMQSGFGLKYIDLNGNDLTFNGNLTISDGTLEIDDGGSMIMSNAVGTITMSGGTLKLSGSGSIDSASDFIFTSGTLEYSNSTGTVNLTGDITIGGGDFTTMGAGTIVLDGGASTQTLTSDGGTIFDLQVGSASAGAVMAVDDHFYVDGDLTFGNGDATTIDITDDTLFVGGDLNFTNADTMTLSSGTVILSAREGSRTITSNSAQYNDLYLTNGLVGYWKLDSTAPAGVVDYSGYGNDGTVNGNPTTSANVAPVNFPNAGAIDFDGTDDHINGGDILDFDQSDALSITAWVKRDTTGVFEAIVSKMLVSGTFRGWMLWFDNTDEVQFVLYSDVVSSNILSVETQATFTDTTAWHHYAVTYTGSSAASGVKLYVDGVEQTTDIENDALTATTITSAPFNIGARNSAENELNGLIDDVRIYNRALSSDEVAMLARGGGAVASATYTLADALDVNGNLSLWSGTLDLSGNNINIDGGSSVFNFGGVVTGDGDEFQTIDLFAHHGGSGVFDGAVTATLPSTVSSFEDLTFNNASGIWTLGADTSIYNDLTITNGWVYSGGNDVNLGGSMVASGGTFDFSAGGTTTLGGSFTAHKTYSGDEAAQTITSNDGTFSALTINAINNTWTIQDNLNVDGDLTLTDGTLNDNGLAIFAGGSVDISSGTYTTTGTLVLDSDDDATFTPPSSAINDLSVTDSLVGYWKLDSTASTGVLDHSGYGNHGTVFGNPTTSTSDKAPLHYANAGAIDLDGTDDYVDANGPVYDPVLGTGSITIATWMNPDNITAGLSIAGKRDTSGNTGYHFQFAGATANDPLLFTIFGVLDQTSSATGAVAASWQHVAVTYDKSNIIFYFNGAQVSSHAQTNDIGDASAINLGIGALVQDGSPTASEFTGLLDDFRVYNRALTATEVAALAAGNTPNSGVANFTLAAAMDVDGDLVLSSGTVLLGSYSHTLVGNWYNYGADVSAQTSTVTLDGSSDGVIETGLEAFNNLVLNRNGNTLTINDGISVDDTFTYTAGIMTPSTDVDAVGLLTDLTMSNANVTFTGNATPVFMDGELTISNGQFTAPTTDLYVHNINQTGGTITATSGTITLRSASNETLIVSGTLNSVNLNEGLVGYWKLDESAENLCTGGTNDACDSSGYGNDGAYVGTNIAPSTTTAPLQFSNPHSVVFNGTDDTISIPNDADSIELETDHDFTIAYWMNLDAAIGVFYATVMKGSFNTSYGHLIQTGDNLLVYTDDDAGPELTISNFMDTDNDLNFWIHVVQTFKDGDIVVYKNGEQVGSGTGQSLTTNTDGLYLGSRINNNYYFDGELDDVRIYKRALTADEVKMLANGFGPGQSGKDITYTLGAALDVDDDLNIAAGTLDVSGSNYGITIAGDWNVDGSLTAQSGTVTLDGNATQTISLGSITINDLTITNNAVAAYVDFTEGWTVNDLNATTNDVKMRFANATTFTISGSLNVGGSNFGNEVSMEATSGGGADWILGMPSQQTVYFVDISDSNTTGFDVIAINSIDGGGNDTTTPKWVFSVVGGGTRGSDLFMGFSF